MDALLSVFRDWPHLLLLGGATLAGILIGIGILKGEEKWTIAAVLVLIGVILEPIFTLWLFVYDESIGRSQQEQIRIATDRATDAGFDAVVANNEAAEANERAAKLEKEAAQLRLELARATAPRNLLTKDETALTNDLRSFGPFKYDLATPRMMEPGSFLIVQLVGALSKANWQLQSYGGPLLSQPLPFNAVMALPNMTPQKAWDTKPLTGVESDLIGIRIRYDFRLKGSSDAAFRLAFWLTHGGAMAEPDMMPFSEAKEGEPPHHLPVDDVIHIEIGRRQ